MSLRILYFIFCSLFLLNVKAQSSDYPQLQKGWQALIKDNEESAYNYFSAGYTQAKEEGDLKAEAEALLCLGICTYGSDLEKGLKYALSSLATYEKAIQKYPNVHQAHIGKAKSLQLISTIYSVQKKYNQAFEMSASAIKVLKKHTDKSGTLGLSYCSLGKIFETQGKRDSAYVYFKLGFDDFVKSNAKAYLPNAYIKLGEYALPNVKSSLALFYKAFAIAKTTENKQAQVSSLIALGKLFLRTDINKALTFFKQSIGISKQLSNKSFEKKSLEMLIEAYRIKKDFIQLAEYQRQLLVINEQLFSVEKEKAIKHLETKFEVAQKDRTLALVTKEKEIIKLSNYLLILGILILLTGFILWYAYVKKINTKNKELLKLKEDVLVATEEKRKLEEEQYKSDLEHKESQLNTILMQMFQKNELLNEVKETLVSDAQVSQHLIKLVQKHSEHNDTWNDFNVYFESVNKQFYTKLKQVCPDISANDLKICALIKLNLSSKEMASILNISPDSVKTARYRLRKKMNLTTETSLIDYILSL
ncbi:tetratricopeptide repeat protein [Flavobacterium sp.]|uniref:tetratricopeptide repeat protein n=1 Tax=Flavobacterium sp. TaxID=239 RepID=UPI003D0F6CEA